MGLAIVVLKMKTVHLVGWAISLQREAAELLFQCLLEMGQQESNPVLQVLSNTLDIEQKRKYPEDLLQFNGMGWRAYYHCHSNKDDINHLFEAEHGHFHIFIRLTEKPVTWTHVVSLSIDDMGQPLRWFMVNHWVTAEDWLAAPLLSEKLQNIPFAEQNTLLEQWLLSMVALFKNEIMGLLISRDKVLEINGTEGYRQDRQHYLLAEQAIHLQDKLEHIIG